MLRRLQPQKTIVICPQKSVDADMLKVVDRHRSNSTLQFLSRNVECVEIYRLLRVFESLEQDDCLPQIAV